MRQVLFLTIIVLFSIVSYSQSNYATLYVYRPGNISGSAINYNLHVNDSVVCRVRNKCAFVIKLYKEGEANIWASTESKREAVLNVKFGEEYYIRCSVAMGVFVGVPKIKIEDSEKGKKDFEKAEGKK